MHVGLDIISQTTSRHDNTDLPKSSWAPSGVQALTSGVWPLWCVSKRLYTPHSLTISRSLSSSPETISLIHSLAQSMARMTITLRKSSNSSAHFPNPFAYQANGHKKFSTARASYATSIVFDTGHSRTYCERNIISASKKPNESATSFCPCSSCCR